MLCYHYLYQNPSQFEAMILQGVLRADAPYFICIHTAQHTPQQALAFVRHLAALFPQAQIAGTSTSDILYHGRLYSGKCLVSFFLFEQVQVQVARFPWPDETPEQLAQKVQDTLCGAQTCAMLHFFSGLYPHVYYYLQAMQTYETNVKIVGGIVGAPEYEAQDGFVVTQEGYFTHDLLAVSFSGAALRTYADALVGHEAIGDIYTITKTNGMEIEEVDGVRASEWFRELLGCESLEENINWNVTVQTDVLLKFPLMLEGPCGGSRFVQYIQEGDSIQLYFSELKEGQKFRIGYASPLAGVNECRQLCDAMKTTPTEALLCYSCLFRKLYRNRAAEWEMTPFADAKVCGALMKGEIGYINGQNTFQNGSSCLLSLAENEVYISIDTSVFSSIKQIEDDGKDLFTYVLRQQNKAMHNKNQQLMHQVLAQESAVNDRLFMEASTWRPNLTKFLYDDQEYQYNKLCMVTVEQEQAALSRLGEDMFAQIMRINMDDIEAHLTQLRLEQQVRIYQQSAHSFLLAAKKEMNDATFYELAQDLFVKFGARTFTQHKYICVHRFVVVLGQKSPLEKARLTVMDRRNEHSRFLLYNADENMENVVADALNMAVLINNAIENDGVVPYFQPVIDNKTGKVYGFEALMRLRAEDGTLYYPAQFMQIAKTYRLYEQLSKMMIHKVFDLFETRPEKVSINLSAQDLASKEIKQVIYSRLAHLQSAENIVFEVLESEDLREVGELAEFVSAVRSYHGKISIDDFGTGFSNLLEIARLKPDYIKIEGELIRGVLQSDIHRKLIDMILYLGRTFEIELVAEYVETEELQHYVCSHNVRYSQGYYFAPALPFEEAVTRFSAQQ